MKLNFDIRILNFELALVTLPGSSLNWRLFSYQHFHFIERTFELSTKISNVLAHLLAPYPEHVLFIDYGGSSLGIFAPAQRDSCLAQLKLQIKIEFF